VKLQHYQQCAEKGCHPVKWKESKLLLSCYAAVLHFDIFNSIRPCSNTFEVQWQYDNTTGTNLLLSPTAKEFCKTIQHLPELCLRLDWKGFY